MTEPSRDRLLTQITPYSVSFLCPGKDDEGRDGILPSGSGVFVNIGGVKGILTAAHVIRKILKHPRCHLLLFNEKEAPAPKLAFNTDQRDAVTIGKIDGRDGPDLGFLKLPHELEGWLLSKAVFYNFDVRLKRADEPNTLPLTREIAAGVMSERTTNKSYSEEKRTDVHTLSLAYGAAYNNRKTDEEFDLFDFAIQHSDEVPPPEKSYGGLSGGAIWSAADEPGTNNLILTGIVFYEDWTETGAHHLICHGPGSVYGPIADAVISKFGHLAHG